MKYRPSCKIDQCWRQKQRTGKAFGIWGQRDGKERQSRWISKEGNMEEMTLALKDGELGQARGHTCTALPMQVCAVYIHVLLSHLLQKNWTNMCFFP